MATKCIKVSLEYSKDNILGSKDFFKELRDIQYKSYRACNTAMTYLYHNDIQNILQKDIGLPTQDDKDIYGKSFQAWIESKMNETMTGALSTNVAQTRSYVISRYRDDRDNKKLLQGNVSLTRFKKNNPVIIHNKAYKILDTPKGLGIEIGFFNKDKQKELGVKRIKFNLPSLRGSEKSIIRGIFDGSYKQGSAQILYNERKKKWMIAISFSFEPQERHTKDYLTMGIDLGITNVATIAILDTNKNEYIQMYWKDRAIDGKELIHYRQKVEARRKELSIASKWASDNNTGHGYKTKLEKKNFIGDKYNRFKETYNHKVSRYIVDLAEKYEVGLIQMEDLSGFSEEQENSLLKNWSYFDLQTKVKYKAEEKGIKLHLINPKYTSQRCNVCGSIAKENRLTQKIFSCVVCKNIDNADINASKNIAMPNIENIIKETIKTKK